MNVNTAIFGRVYGSLDLGFGADNRDPKQIARAMAPLVGIRSKKTVLHEI